MWSHKTTCLAACLLFASQAAAVHAQLLNDAFCADCCEHDYQLFSPTEFDYDCRAMRKDCGWFFAYDKLSWNFSGKTTVIGDPTINVQSEQIFRETTFSDGTAPPTFTINNSVQDAPPLAKFGWGERYEFGYKSNGAGWLFGVLDGPAATSKQVYGFQQVQLPNTLPTIRPNNINFSDFGVTFTGPDGVIVGSADTSTSRNGFGSVHVNFATPDGWLLGFRDYWINGPDNQPGPSVGGPGRRVLAATIDETGITDITWITGADGIVDDIDGDGVTFFAIVVEIDGEDVIVGTGTDFDDLHMFNIRFDTLTVRNRTETQGFELMKTYDLSNSHKMTKNQDHTASIGYGLRYLRIEDDFFWEGKGDVLGRTYADTGVRNSIIGPQVRLMWNKARGRWNTNFDGRVMLGANFQNQTQIGAIGEDLLPGGLNTPVGAQPHAVKYSRQIDNFSPVAEIRAQTSYQITSSIAARLGYTGTYIDNITRASQTVRWYLPDLGLLKGGKDEIFINGVNFGFDVTY